MNEAGDLRKNISLKNLTLVNFVHLTENEMEMVRRWRNSDSVRRWMYQDHLISTEEHRAFLQSLTSNDKSFSWLAKESDGTSLGIISLNNVDFRNRHAYLGIYTNPATTQGHAGTALLESLKEIAFRVAHLHTLKLEVLQQNDRAINFYKKAGFVEEGVLKEFIFRDNHWCDVIIMGLTEPSRKTS